jgi:hypothetical protein
MPTLMRNVQGLFDTLTNDFVGILDPISRTEYYFEVQKGGAYPSQMVGGKETKFQVVNSDLSGTPGNVTNNNPAGIVAVPAGGQSITVSNSLVTAASIVQITLMSNDGTAKSAVVVVSAGSFTITLNAAATAITKIGYIVIL